MDFDQLKKTIRDPQGLPDDIFAPKAMLGRGEQALLYLLARDFLQPGNAIVDAGAFIGGSTYAFAAGLRDRPDADKCRGHIYSYDQFLVDAQYLHQYLSKHFPDTYAYTGQPLNAKKPFSFRPLYDAQIADVKDYVTTIEGSLLDQSWDQGKAIDVLFVDVCKTLELNRFVLRHFFPAMIPGRSILIQQDFHHIFHPYIHASMEMLRDYFDCVIGGVGGSRVYRLVKPIPEALLEQVAAFEYDRATVVTALEDVVRHSPERLQPLLRYLVPWMYHQWGDDDEAFARAQAITRELRTAGKTIPDQAYQAFPRLQGEA